MGIEDWSGRSLPFPTFFPILFLVHNQKTIVPAQAGLCGLPGSVPLLPGMQFHLPCLAFLLELLRLASE